MAVTAKIGGEEVLTLLHSLREACCERDGEICKSTNLTPSESRILSTLNFETTISASQFAKQANLSPSRSSRVISKLEKSGFIAVDRSSNDGRRSEISLTLEGIKRRDLLKEAHQNCFKRVENVLSEDEIKVFVGLVGKLISEI